MTTPEQMEAAFVAYCDRLTAGDADGVAALFAADAAIEDPLGVRRYAGPTRSTRSTRERSSGRAPRFD